ncbi:MAG: homoserine dehydrogenase [Myxococcota bacterium]
MKPIHIGLLGLGTVGSAVARLLHDNADRIHAQAGGPIVLRRALVRTVDERNPHGPVVLTDRPEEILEDPDLDIIVEVMGGTTDAVAHMRQALQAGKHVVTANKDALARHGAELFQTARDHHVGLHYEAAVAGGIPIIKSISQALTGNRIKGLMGIINGTTNYMLDRMTREGAPFAEILADAQRLGYAEADPTSDVEGHDATYKLALLAGLAFGAQLDLNQIHREGITTITQEDIRVATELGYVIKLLGIAREVEGEIEARVHPALVPQDHPLASVHEAFNAVFIEGDAVGELMLYGRGAGGSPTASAVLADIVDACQNIRRGVAGRLTPPAQPRPVRSMAQTWSRYYIAFQVAEQPGVLAGIATAFADQGVSLESVIQHGEGHDPVQLVVVTHRVQEAQVQAALGAIEQLPTVHRVTNMLRVEGIR